MAPCTPISSAPLDTSRILSDAGTKIAVAYGAERRSGLFRLGGVFLCLALTEKETLTLLAESWRLFGAAFGVLHRAARQSTFGPVVLHVRLGC